MIGTNSILLNQATIVAALQHYLDTVAFKSKVKVTSVSQEKDSCPSSAFLVTFTDPVESDMD